MEAGKEVIKVNLSSIIPNRFQPRIAFNEEELNELASSIKMYGILQPLILRPIGDKYEIIAGERRYKASTIAGLTEVPAILVNLDDQTSAELAIIENIQRKDLTAIEEAKSYKKLLDLGNLTQDQLATKMGKKQSTIANKLRLLNLVPEAQEALLNNAISERHARSLLQIKDDPAKQREVLNKIMEGRLTVKETDDLIKSLMNVEPIGGGMNMDINNNMMNNNMVDNNINNMNNTVSEPMQFNGFNVASNMESSSINIPSFGVNPTMDMNQSIPQPINEPIINNDIINLNKVSNPNMNIASAPFDFGNGIPVEPIQNVNSMPNPLMDNVQQTLNGMNELNMNINEFNSAIPPVEDTFEQTQVIDINAIKEAAKEEPLMPEIPSYDELLKVEEAPQVEETIEPVQMPKIGEPVTFGNKFFPSLEDESADMSFGTPFNMPPVESAESLLSSQPDLANTNINNFNFGQFNMPSNITGEAVPEVQTPEAPKTKLEEAIDMTRKSIHEIQNTGVKIESQEMDLPHEYQIVIRISKDPAE